MLPYKMKPLASPPAQAAGEEMKPPTSPPPQAVGEQLETDEQGNPIVMTLQTVCSGFYLIDVPIVEP